MASQKTWHFLNRNRSVARIKASAKRGHTHTHTLARNANEIRSFHAMWSKWMGKSEKEMTALWTSQLITLCFKSSNSQLLPISANIDIGWNQPKARFAKWCWWMRNGWTKRQLYIHCVTGRTLIPSIYTVHISHSTEWMFEQCVLSLGNVLYIKQSTSFWIRRLKL